MKLFSLLLIITIFLGPVNTKAAPIFNFGGQIVSMLPCTCSGNWILYIRDVRYQVPLPLIYQPGASILYKLYQPRPAVNSLGSYIPGAGSCLVYVGSGCSTIFTLGGILQLGTSAAIAPGK